MKAMIFAAGMGTRLKPLTDSMPKALVPLAGRTLLQWQVDKLREAGITDIIVNVHHFADQIIQTVDHQQGWGTHIQISDEREQLLDTGGGVYKAIHDLMGQLDEDLLLCNVDILSTISVPDLLKHNASAANDALLVVSQRQTQRYLCFDNDGWLCGWTNTTTGEQKGQDGQRLAYSGMAILKPTMWPVLQHLAQTKGEVFSVIDVYLQAMADHKRLQAYIPNNYRMMDVGKIEKIKEAETFAESLRSL